VEVGLSVYQSVQLVVPAATPLSAWCLLLPALGGMSSAIKCGKCGPDALIPTHGVVVVDPVRRRHLRQRWGRCTNCELQKLLEDFGAGSRPSEMGLLRKTNALSGGPAGFDATEPLMRPISEDSKLFVPSGTTPPLLHRLERAFGERWCLPARL